MTEYKNLSIATATITIKVIQVDGHKMTKATYNQITKKQLSLYQDAGLGYSYVLNMNPRRILGWVRNSYGIEMLFLDSRNSLCRHLISESMGLYLAYEHRPGEKACINFFDIIQQLFIAT